jgi:chemotaxis protein methyltransferase CheR
MDVWHGWREFLTNGEDREDIMGSTFFLRDTHTLEHIALQLLPRFTGRTKTKIWDAGCAHGPEPYTLAMVLAENIDAAVFQNVTIDATDYDPTGQLGTTVVSGIYPMEELEKIPKEILYKYFEPSGERAGCYKVRDLLRNRVQFQRHDLLSLQPISDGYSLILCKNVLLHFQYEQRIQVIRMFHQALEPEGFFATEQTQKMPPEIAHLFQQVVTDAQLFKAVHSAR